MTSQVYEEMDYAEFTQMYNKKAAELDGEKEALKQGTGQLKEIQEIEETEELKKFAEMMQKCEKIKNKTQLQVDLRDMEIRIIAREKELKDMSSIFIEVQNIQRKKQNAQSQSK